MTKELTQFKYEQLDESTADFLRQKESNMRQIVGKAYTELGRELTEARDRLAGNNQYDGVFEKWYTTVLGMNRKMVNRLIQRYELVVTNCHKQELLEDMPVSLTYEIAKPSSESTPAKTQAKTEVLAGDIATLKEYRERIKELEKQAEAERKERERLEVENEELVNREPEVRVETRTEYIEIRDEYSEQRAEEAEARLREYEERFGDIRNYDEQVSASNRQDMIVAIGSFNKGVRDFAKRYAYLTNYRSVIESMDGTRKEQFNEAVTALKEIAGEFEFIGDVTVIIDQ